MTAVRLRRIGNRGVLVDPGAVVAVTPTVDNCGVRVVLAAGVAIEVVRLTGTDGVTAEDLEKVRHQLTLKAT